MHVKRMFYVSSDFFIRMMVEYVIYNIIDIYFLGFL